jgi:hypothetical protein
MNTIMIILSAIIVMLGIALIETLISAILLERWWVKIIYFIFAVLFTTLEVIMIIRIVLWL